LSDRDRKALAAKRAKLAQLAFSLSADWLAVAQPDGAILHCNEAWTAAFGHGDGLLRERLPATLIQKWVEGANSAEPTLVQVETRMGPRWVEATAVLRRDVALIKLTEAQVRQSGDTDRDAAQLATNLLLQDAGVVGTVYDADKQVYAFTSALADANGKARMTFPSSVLEPTLHPDDLADVVAERDRLAREGGRQVREVRARSLETGEWVRSKLLQRSGRRLPSGTFEVFSLSQDITELAQARDEAEAKARQLALALDAARAGTFAIDYTAERVDCSPEFVRIAGPRFAFDQVAIQRRRMAAGNVARARSGERGVGATGVDVQVPVNGQDRWLRFYTDVTLSADGEPSSAVGLVLDIDEAKRQELALQAAQVAAQTANEAKSRFLATMSHEIRTPMNGVVGVLHLLKSEPLSMEGRHLLDEALSCSAMLSQLIDDVLDVSKIEAGKLEIFPEPTRLADAVEGVMALLQPRAQAKGLFLRTEVAPEFEGVLLDPIRLRQCLFNLVGNAVKFTDHGGVAVGITRPAPGRLRIEVSDTGAGIPPAAQARLFQRFKQADTAATRLHGGTGLGLAITRSLVELMAGEIGLRSAEGDGSVFWFEIAAPAVEIAPPGVEAPTGDAPLAGLTLLVVDDNAVNRLVAVKIVEALGAAAEAVESGPEAIGAVRTGRFDLVLMDVNMPGMDGLEATRRIRDLPGMQQLPILALTANVMAHQKAEYLRSGMDGAVPKPFSPAVLLEEILRVASGETGIASTAQSA
jgi:signal transduction histidine kinase/ActR/RegA family two-component response regulator